MKDHRNSSIMKKVLASNQISRENTIKENKNQKVESINHDQLRNKLSVIQEVASRTGSCDFTDNKSIGTSQRLTRRQSESNINDYNLNSNSKRGCQTVEFAKRIMLKRRSFSRNSGSRSNNMFSTINFEESSIGTINSTIQNKLII